MALKMKSAGSTGDTRPFTSARQPCAQRSVTSNQPADGASTWKVNRSGQ
jgi:hypothetical protein